MNLNISPKVLRPVLDLTLSHAVSLSFADDFAPPIARAREGKAAGAVLLWLNQGAWRQRRSDRFIDCQPRVLEMAKLARR